VVKRVSASRKLIRDRHEGQRVTLYISPTAANISAKPNALQIIMTHVTCYAVESCPANELNYEFLAPASLRAV